MESPVVTIKQGQLRGCVSADIDGGKIISFLGIPFAKPPIGELRFKAPVPADPWRGVRDATKQGDSCYSRELMTCVLGGSEDCLNLNVFTKSLPVSDQKLKPVMVWIHGGGFTSGSNRTETYGPEFLLTEDIVLVSINYRLGALGFLSLNDTSLGVPGNAGLKDQVLALKWVQENIEMFNGDPNNVTIFGESAGSASVHLHVLSSSSQGLFHKAILQSATALLFGAVPTVYAAEVLLEQLGQKVSDEKEALEILRGTPVDKLYDAQLGTKASLNPLGRAYFGPVIEKPNDTAFITQNPMDIIRSGEYNQVPLMFGYTNREGMALEVNIIMKAMWGGKPEEPPNIEDVIPWQINLKRGSEISKKICQKIEDFYFKGPDSVDNKYVLATDSMIVAGMMASIKNHLATSQNPIYLYRMSLDAGLNVLKNIGKLHNQPGACHCDDLGYLFKNELNPEMKPGSLEDISVRRFVKLWTNFAKYGNPTPNKKDISVRGFVKSWTNFAKYGSPTPNKKELGVTWEPVNEKAFNFLDIGKELTVDTNPESERMALWREIYQLGADTADFL